MIRTEFATADIRLILEFKSGGIWQIRVVTWWMLSWILKLKSLAHLTQMIIFTTMNFSLDVMVETFLNRMAQ